MCFHANGAFTPACLAIGLPFATGCVRCVVSGDLLAVCFSQKWNLFWDHVERVTWTEMADNLVFLINVTHANKINFEYLPQFYTNIYAWRSHGVSLFMCTHLLTFFKRDATTRRLHFINLFISNESSLSKCASFKMWLNVVNVYTGVVYQIRS